MFHGGKSTGPITKDGRKHCAIVKTIHGYETRAAREYRAKKFIEMLDGEFKEFQHIVELNAWAALYISGKVNNLKDGFALAKKVIDEKITKNYLHKITS